MTCRWSSDSSEVPDRTVKLPMEKQHSLVADIVGDWQRNTLVGGVVLMMVS